MAKKLKVTLVILILLQMTIQTLSSLAVSIGDTIYLQRANKGFYSIQKWTGKEWQYVTYSITHYTDENGNSQIAYCIDPDLIGVGWIAGEVEGYNANLTQVLSNEKLWRAYTNGYPYKTPSELGVETEDDAYLATKMAGYCIIRGYSLDDVKALYRAGTTSIENESVEDIQRRGQKVIDAIYNLVNIGYNGTKNQNSEVSIKKVGEFSQDEKLEYYSQKYSVTSKSDISDYTVTSISNFPTGTIITDLDGNEKSKFSSGEQFKVLVPKSNIIENISGSIKVEASCKIYPLLVAEGPSGKQKYVVCGKLYGTISSNATLDIKSNLATIKISKVDSETLSAISDTIFALQSKDGTALVNATTNEKGVATFSGLNQGEYVLKEISANDNYILDETSRKITIGYNEQINIEIENKHKAGKLKIYKVDKDNNRVVLGNVEFDLYSEELDKIVGTYKTDVNGEITVDNLRTGDYKIIEKSTGKWYNLADDVDVKIEWDKTTTQTIENELKKAQIRVIKVDADNNEVKLKGVKFNVLDENNNVLETIITNDEGEALTSKYAVRDFEKLTLQEVDTLENYILTKETQTITLNENEIVNVTFTNEKKKGQIKVIKVDLDNNEVKIPNVEFNVYDEEGNIVDTLITDENGEATSIRLPIDQNYMVQETKTGEYYVLNEEPQTAVLEQDKITELTFTNEKKKGQIKVIKVDLDNNEVKLPNVEFNVYDEEGNIVDTLITDENGEATSIRLPIDQNYVVQESKTLQNYVLNEEPQTVVLKQDKITDITFTNEKIKGYIEITKVSADDNELTGEEKGTLLKDAVFEIYTDKDKLADTITIGEDGKGTSNLLEYGNYYIKEQDSGSDYYLLNTEKYNVEIKEHLKTVPITIENTSVNIKLDIDKNGIVQAQPNDEIKYSFNTLKNISNVALDNFTWTDNLPYKYVRITKLFTGTYNQDLDYIVKYKTNKSEDYIEYGTYNTKKNNYIDFTSIELEDGEYITDYKIEFGTVMSGFEAVEKPFIFTKVLPTVASDDKWTNYTTLSGNYKDHNIEDKAEWTTKTYKKELEIKKLPRTGY